MKHLMTLMALVIAVTAGAQVMDTIVIGNEVHFNLKYAKLDSIISDLQAQVDVDTIILQPDGSFEVQLNNGTTFTQVQGCTDTAYLEYNAMANTDDGSCATLIVNGCTDSAYVEYNASANTDDGSCATLVVQGCTDPAYLEYNASANTDDGSCATLIVNGCTDSAYVEYNASANTDDGSCATLVVQGCTDPAYLEYNASANTDDGSCATLIVNGCTDSNYTEYDAEANTDDGSCVTLVVEGCIDAAYTNYDPDANTDDGSCTVYCSSSIEFDNYTYSVVEIGAQCWFAENLRTTVYADGSSIPQVTGDFAWAGLSTDARCNYDNNAANVATYGRLYNLYAVTNAAGLCPNGWHVPTDGEWTALEDYITAQGFNGTEGTALKSTSGWSNGIGTDDFGFSALPGGNRSKNNGFFNNAGIYGYWWSSSLSGDNAWRRSLSSATDVGRNASDPRVGISVRCTRDAE